EGGGASALRERLRRRAESAGPQGPGPKASERLAEWSSLVASALEGLGELGDPAVLTDLIPLLDSPHAEIRKQAAHALAWVAPAESTGSLQEALSHSDPEVRHRAALGLAYLGDPSVLPLLE